MDVVCDKTNRRRYLRCLKAFLNGLRQYNDLSAYRTITKYKKQLNVPTASAAYEVAENLYETRDNKFPAFNSMYDMKWTLYDNFAGKSVRILYLLDRADDDTRVIVRDKLYTIPSTEHEMTQWWDKKREWEWLKDSDKTIFDEYDGSGDVYITERLALTGNHISQSYLDNATQNCVFEPIIKRCQYKLEINSDVKKHRALLNNMNKISKLDKYKNGVTDDELEKLCHELKLKIHISFPLIGSIRDFGNSVKRPNMVMNYLNSRLNHLEDMSDETKMYVMGKYYDDNEFETCILNDIEFDDMYGKLVNDVYDRNFVYKRDGVKITMLKTLTTTYKRAQSEAFEPISRFVEEYNMKQYRLCDVKDELLSQFIRSSAHVTSFKINSDFEGKQLDQYVNIYEEIDADKAFASFEKCHLYSGFVGKITDFRQTNKIMGEGFYLIGALDWTNADVRFYKFQNKFKAYYGRNIYAKPDLVFLTSLGVKYKILGGAWGMPFKFKFPDYMYEKVNKVSHYARWTGMCIRDNEPDMYHMMAEPEYADIVKKYASDTVDIDFTPNLNFNDRNAKLSFNSKMNNVGELTFTQKRKFHTHYAHIASYIYAYQRISTITQILDMDLDKVIRVNVDGIKYIPHQFSYDTKKFKSKPVHELRSKTRGLTMKGREEGFLTMMNSCDPLVWKKFHSHFMTTSPRPHFQNELFSGKGGTGKTHRNMTDKGLIRVGYIAPNHKLKQVKCSEFNSSGDVYHNLIEDIKALDIPEDERPRAIDRRVAKLLSLIYLYNVLVIDECSMLSDKVREIIFTRFWMCKLIFIGDIGFQIGPYNEIPIRKTAFQHVTELIKNHRCKDAPLDKILDNIRETISKCGNRTCNVKEIINGIQTITVNELQKKYKVEDIILNFQNTEKDKYTKLFSHLEKFYVTKCSKNHEYNTGEIHFTKPATVNCELRHGYTVHSVQGETFKKNIFINEDVLNDLNVLYTALSRAEYLHQIYIITDN